MTATMTTDLRTPLGSDTMQAVVHDRYGPSDVLQVRRVARPTIGANDVLVRVSAVSPNRGDVHLMTGLPYLVRLFGFGVRRPKPGRNIRGTDLAGTVEAVGAEVTSHRPGDEVFGWTPGAFAEYAAGPADRLLPRPSGLTPEQAAALPISGVTALQAVRDVGEVQTGQSVLVTGAAGGVGSFVVQIAQAFGGRVTGVCSTAKLDAVRSLGAEDVIDHTRTDFTRSGRRWDVIIDTAGRRSLRDLRRSLTSRGTLVIVGGEGGDRFLAGTDRNLRAALWSPFISQRLKAFVSRERREDLEALVALVAAGAVTPLLDRTWPLVDAREAMCHLDEGRACGKVVLTV